MTEPHPLGLLVRKLAGHRPLDEEDRAALLALPHTVSAMRASAYLIREGEPPRGCAVLVDGFAFRQKLTDDGARQIVSLHIPGDALDLQHLHLDVADHNVQLLTAATVATIPRADLRQIVSERPTVAGAVAISNLIEGSIMREWVLNVGRRDARQRLAHLLCEFAVRLEGQKLVGDYGYDLPMTQEQLGDALGLTPVHVNRTIKALEAEGLIARCKRSITFPDWNRMRDMAGFSDLYLHRGQQKAA